jgi:hypothetical protein
VLPAPFRLRAQILRRASKEAADQGAATTIG